MAEGGPTQEMPSLKGNGVSNRGVDAKGKVPTNFSEVVIAEDVAESGAAHEAGTAAPTNTRNCRACGKSHIVLECRFWWVNNLLRVP